MVVDYEVEVDYGDEELDDSEPIPGESQIESWIREGMRLDGVAPAAVRVTRQG